MPKNIVSELIREVKDGIDDAREVVHAGKSFVNEVFDRGPPGGPPISYDIPQRGSRMSVVPLTSRRRSRLSLPPKSYGTNAVLITGRDYIGEVTTSTGDVGEVAFSRLLNPAMGSGRLRAQAMSWEQYLPVEVSLEYEPAVATTTSGQLHFIPDTDPDGLVSAGSYMSISSESSEQGARTTSVFKPCIVKVPIPDKQNVRYCSSTASTTGASEDLRLTCFGKFSVLRGAGCADSTQFGCLWVRYKIAFMVPASEPEAGNAKSGTWTAGGATWAAMLTSSNWTGTGGSAWEGIVASTTPASTIISFHSQLKPSRICFRIVAGGAGLTLTGATWSGATNISTLGMVNAGGTIAMLTAEATVLPGAAVSLTLTGTGGTVTPPSFLMASVMDNYPVYARGAGNVPQIESCHVPDPPVLARAAAAASQQAAQPPPQADRGRCRCPKDKSCSDYVMVSDAWPKGAD